MTARPQLPDRTPRAKDVPTALDGLLVVDFTRVVAGPACTQTLADFGAEVIKIENPDGGDDTRSYEHADLAGESAAFISLNRNKRGIVLDFTNPAAREVARELPPSLESIYRCDDCDTLLLHSDALRLETGHWQII